MANVWMDHHFLVLKGGGTVCSTEVPGVSPAAHPQLSAHQPSIGGLITQSSSSENERVCSAGGDGTRVVGNES